MINPILRREVITIMRNWKTYASLAIFLIIIAVGTNFTVYTNMFQYDIISFDPQYTYALYVVLASTQMALVMLIVPGVAASSISGERERQTLDLLLVTKMSPLSIVMGKWMVSLMYVLLFVVGSLPVFGVALYFSSVSILQILQLFLFVLINTCMIGAISVFFSCVFKKTTTSIILVYLVIGGLCFGTLLLFGFLLFSSYNIPPFWLIMLILIPNPGVGFFSMIDTQLGTDISGIIKNSIDGSSWEMWMLSHIWILYTVFAVVMTVVFIWLSAKIINPIRERKRSYKK